MENKIIHAPTCGVNALDGPQVCTCDSLGLYTNRTPDARVNPVQPSLTDARVNHPPHYKNHPSGVECIEITKHESFCIGNAMKYIWRHKDKGRQVEDLKKAIWYLEEQIRMYTEEARK